MHFFLISAVFGVQRAKNANFEVFETILPCGGNFAVRAKITPRFHIIYNIVMRNIPHQEAIHLLKEIGFIKGK